MSAYLNPIVIDDDTQMSLAELARACRAQEEQVRVWVVEGVLQPLGPPPPGAAPPWRFGGTALRRARLAITLTREMEVNPPGVALALDLMDEIEALKASLRRIGAR